MYILLPSAMRQKYRKKMKHFFMPFVVLFVSTSAQATYSKLAKHAGVSHAAMNKIVKKLVVIESSTGNYTVRNHRSGAYGRYQVMPKTAKFYARKLKIPYRKWKKPHNQDKIFKAIMKDNIRSLKKNGHKVTAFSIYGSHQQGAGGFNAIMKNKKLTKKMERNIRQNLPKRLKYTSRKNLKKTWLRYWKRRLA
jgi:hypothetical protein